MHRCVIFLACAGLVQSALAAQVSTPYFSVQGNATAGATGTADVYVYADGFLDVQDSFADFELFIGSFENGFSFGASADTDGGLASNGQMTIPMYLNNLGVFLPDSPNLGGFRSSSQISGGITQTRQIGRYSFELNWSLTSDYIGEFAMGDFYNADEDEFVDVEVYIDGFFNASAETGFLFSIPDPILMLQNDFSDSAYPFDTHFTGSALMPGGVDPGAISVFAVDNFLTPQELFDTTGILITQAEFDALITEFGDSDIFLLAAGTYSLSGLLEAFGNDEEFFEGSFELVFIPSPSAAAGLLLGGAAGLRRRR